MLGYQLKITIKDSHPPIWRRVIVPSHITFFDLDDIIEAMFGWTHEHLFAFNFPYMDMEFIGAPIKQDEDNADECIDEWIEVGDSFLYTYDFGDDWRHTIKVEKVVKYDKRYPQVIKSKGPYMIENCGGIWGFYRFINEAEPFDMEKMNEEFKKWNFPEVYAEHTIEEELDEGLEWMEEVKTIIDEMSKGNIPPMIQEFLEQEGILREQLSDIESLEIVFNQYTKDDLKIIAREYGFKGYSKFNKKELACWLKEQLLENECMEMTLRTVSEEEMNFFEHAIEEHGIVVPYKVIKSSLLLANYGAYNQYCSFYRVPLDVQEKYKEVNTPEFHQEMKRRYDFLKYCNAAVYLYGVIPINKLIQIYNDYEDEQMTTMQARRLILEYIKDDEPYVIKNNLLMDEDLEEMNLYESVMEQQKEYTYYIPKDKEEFLNYGKCECQEPDENTNFFVNYLKKIHHKKEIEALMIFYEIQHGIRMNASDEELIGYLLDMECKISSQKKMREAFDYIHKLGNYIRTWDLKGHSWQEIQDEMNKNNVRLGGSKGKIIPLLVNNPANNSVNNKVYPNAPCPCGSGKKYKYCCGKNKRI